jgi:Cupin domain
MYHWETETEAFLVLSGEALLIVEGRKRPLRQWDFVHCPPGTNHVIVGAGDGPCFMGAAASMLSWEDEFCERLASGRRFVIRYDHRDTGRSVIYAPGAPGYTGIDLVADAAGVLDAPGHRRCPPRRHVDGRGDRAARRARLSGPRLVAHAHLDQPWFRCRPSGDVGRAPPISPSLSRSRTGPTGMP